MRLAIQEAVTARSLTIKYIKRVVFVPLWKPSQHDNLVVTSTAQMPRINRALESKHKPSKSVQFYKDRENVD
jgi:hypothetical protein